MSTSASCRHVSPREPFWYGRQSRTRERVLRWAVDAERWRHVDDRIAGVFQVGDFRCRIAPFLRSVCLSRIDLLTAVIVCHAISPSNDARRHGSAKALRRANTGGASLRPSRSPAVVIPGGRRALSECPAGKSSRYVRNRRCSLERESPSMDQAPPNDAAMRIV
jgi:hypothetical protein